MHGDPARLGFDPESLDAIAQELEALGSNCFVVIRDGEIAGEWYWNSTDESSRQQIFSTTKSYTSTLVGIAQAQGVLDIDDKVSDYVDAWAGTASASVTIRNLLSGDSGRPAPLRDGLSEQQSTEELLTFITQADADGAALQPPQDHSPGTVWAYNDPAIQVLGAVLREATGQEPRMYAEEHLFDPIGAQATRLATDAVGHTRMNDGLRTTCRDAARFGLLYLRHGQWDGVQIVPEDWVLEATGSPSQDLFPAYGYLWWLNRASDGPLDTAAVQLPAAHASLYAHNRQIAPDAPADMYWAVGAFGQIIQVDPGSRTVVVRLGNAHPQGGTGMHFLPYTTRVVTTALIDQ